jgi:sugar diacid utilization regulator
VLEAVAGDTTIDGSAAFAGAADTTLREQLLSMHAVLVLSLVLARSRSTKQIVHLATTAVRAVGRCRTLGIFHPTRSGSYFELAGRELCPQLLRAGLNGANLTLAGQAWSHAYPLATSGREDRPFFVVAADTEPSAQEKFLISVLAQTCGTAISNADFLEAERATASTMTDLNAQLESTVASLRKSMEIHQRLNDTAASQQGESGIATALFELTGRAVRIEDRYGNVRASAGVTATSPDRQPWSGKQRQAARALIARLRGERRPVYDRGAWFALAEPRRDVVGVICVESETPEGLGNDLVALEYAATVLSIELARTQSVLETELRMRRDLAEELLSGEDDAATQIQAHALGYDLLRPHRVVIVSVGGRANFDDAFFRLVGRHAKRLDIGSLIVSRSDGVVVLAHTDTDWQDLLSHLAEEAGAKKPSLALGGRYDQPSDIPRSYREAKFAVSIRKAIARDSAAQVLHFENLGVYRILSTVSDLDEVERFMREMLGPLIDYDRKRNAELVNTLARYLECGCNYDLTAEGLHIHRSTFKYRLQRIRELLGVDMTNGEVRFQLQFATKIWQTLQVIGPEAVTRTSSSPS